MSLYLLFRREHLTDDDLKKNKEILETFAKGAIQEIDVSSNSNFSQNLMKFLSIIFVFLDLRH